MGVVGKGAGGKAVVKGGRKVPRGRLVDMRPGLDLGTRSLPNRGRRARVAGGFDPRKVP